MRWRACTSGAKAPFSGGDFLYGLKPVPFTSVIERLETPLIAAAIVHEKAGEGCVAGARQHVPLFGVPAFFAPPAAAGFPGAVGGFDVKDLFAIAKRYGFELTQHHAHGHGRTHAAERRAGRAGFDGLRRAADDEVFHVEGARAMRVYELRGADAVFSGDGL